MSLLGGVWLQQIQEVGLPRSSETHDKHHIGTFRRHRSWFLHLNAKP